MPRLALNQVLDDELSLPSDRQQRRQAKRKPGHRPKRTVDEQLVEVAGFPEKFDLTYNASRHERQWIEDSLGGFYDTQWITDVVRQVKGGKEATVYQCAAHPSVNAGEFIAAKVYRPRQFRQLKKDHLYREGRSNLDADGNIVTNHGMLHAMHKRTSYGNQLLHTSWIEHELATLQILHRAGADVPVPYASADNAILMGFLGDAAGPAPTLNTVRLDPDEAASLYQRVLHNVELMLANERVHGDLSAFNILYWQDQVTLIDFPQAVNPHENANAYRIFERDMRRVGEYFASQGVRVKAGRLAADLWTSYRYSLVPDVNPALLDDQDESDRRYWDRMQKNTQPGNNRRIGGRSA